MCVFPNLLSENLLHADLSGELDLAGVRRVSDLSCGRRLVRFPEALRLRVDVDHRGLHGGVTHQPGDGVRAGAGLAEPHSEWAAPSSWGRTSASTSSPSASLSPAPGPRAQGSTAAPRTSSGAADESPCRAALMNESENQTTFSSGEDSDEKVGLGLLVFREHSGDEIDDSQEDEASANGPEERPEPERGESS